MFVSLFLCCNRFPLKAKKQYWNRCHIAYRDMIVGEFMFPTDIAKISHGKLVQQFCSCNYVVDLFQVVAMDKVWHLVTKLSELNFWNLAKTQKTVYSVIRKIKKFFL